MMGSEGGGEIFSSSGEMVLGSGLDADSNSRVLRLLPPVFFVGTFFAKRLLRQGQRQAQSFALCPDAAVSGLLAGAEGRINRKIVDFATPTSRLGPSNVSAMLVAPGSLKGCHDLGIRARVARARV